MKKTERLARVATSITDGDHQAPPQAETGVPFLTIAAINDGRLNIDRATRFVPRTYYDSLKPERKPALGDLLFSVTGSIAIAAMVDDSRPFTFQRHIAIIKPDPSKVASRYLLHTLRAPIVKEQVRSIATGTAQLTIPLGGLRNLEIPLPSLAEQKRIVAKTDSLLDRSSRARHELDRVSSLVEKYRNALLSAAFQGKLTARWRSNNGIVDGEPSLVTITHPLKRTYFAPSSWRASKLDDICDIVGGSQPPKTSFYYSTGPDLIRLIQIRDYKSDSKATYIPKALARRFCSETDIMIGRYGPPIFQILRGLDGAYNVALMKAVPNPEFVHQEFLYWYLQSQELYNYVNLEAQRTAGQDGVNKAHLMKWPVFLPPLEEQDEIVRQIKAAFAWIARISAEHAKASRLLPKLDHSILAKAFRGELVPQDPNEEPASALLERIRAEPQTKKLQRG